MFMKACASGQHSLTLCSPSVQTEIFKGLVSCASGGQNAKFLKEVHVCYDHVYTCMCGSFGMSGLCFFMTAICIQKFYEIL